MIYGLTGSTNLPGNIVLNAVWEEKDVLFGDGNKLANMEGDVFAIDSAAALQALLDRVDKAGLNDDTNGTLLEGKTFIITEDITFDGSNFNTTFNEKAQFAGKLTAAEGVTLTLNNMKRPLFIKIAESGSVDGVTISGSYVTSRDERSTNNHAMLAGTNYGTVTNCSLVNVDMQMTEETTKDAQYIMGGLVAVNAGTMSGCSAENVTIGINLPEGAFNSGDIASHGDPCDLAVGGLIGYSRKPVSDMTAVSGEIDATSICSASAPSTYYCIGGIAAYSDGGGSNCVNEGLNLHGAGVAGGIFGIVVSTFNNGNENGNIVSCSNSAQVDSYRYAGGIVGWWRTDRQTDDVTGDYIDDCKNTGVVTCTDWAGNLYTAFGGIVGRAMVSGGLIKNCVNGVAAAGSEINTQAIGAADAGSSANTLVIPSKIRNYGGIVGLGYRYHTYDSVLKVENCTNYMSFVEGDGDYSDANMTNIGGIVGGGAILGTQCASYGDVILPDAHKAGGLGGGKAVDTGFGVTKPAGSEGREYDKSDSYWVALYEDGWSDSGTGPSTDDPPSFKDSLFCGQIQTADGEHGGALIGAFGYSLTNCVWINTGSDTTVDRAMGVAATMEQFITSDKLPRGTANCYYAVDGLETLSSEGTMTFVPWSEVKSGELAWKVDGGEETHREAWTQDTTSGLITLGKPTMGRLVLNVEGETIEIFIPVGTSVDVSKYIPAKDSVVEVSGNTTTTTTYDPVISGGNHVTVNADGTITLDSASGNAGVGYETNTSSETTVDTSSDDPTPTPEPEPFIPGDYEGTGDGAGNGDGTGGTGDNAGGTLTDSSNGAPAASQPSSTSRPQSPSVAQPQPVELPEEQQPEDEPQLEEPETPEAPPEEPEDDLQTDVDVEDVEQDNNLLSILLGGAALVIVVLGARIFFAGKRKKK
jgi:hypothetical protein